MSGLLILPNLVWQYSKGFPSLEFYRNAMLNKNIPTGPLEILRVKLSSRILLPFPSGLLAWCTFFSYRWQKVPVSRPVLPCSPVDHGARGIQPSGSDCRHVHRSLWPAARFSLTSSARLERDVRRRSRADLMTTGGLVFVPAFSPILPPAMLRHYLSAIGFHFSVEIGKTDEPLPQWIADRLGWRELASDVAAVYVPFRAKSSGTRYWSARTTARRARSSYTDRSLAFLRSSRLTTVTTTGDRLRSRSRRTSWFLPTGRIWSVSSTASWKRRFIPASTARGRSAGFRSTSHVARVSRQKPPGRLLRTTTNQIRRTGVWRTAGLPVGSNRLRS